MIAVLSLLIGAALVVLVVVGARWLDSRRWRRSLVAYRWRLPADLTSEQVSGWLSTVAALTHAPRGALLPEPPVVVAVEATAEGIDHRLLMPRDMTSAVLAGLRAALPGIRLERVDMAGQSAPVSLAAEVRLAGRRRQLAVERADAASRALLAGLQPLQPGEHVSWQWIFTGAGTPAPIRTSDPPEARNPPWWLEAQAPADADELRAARLKQRQLLLNASGRLVITASSPSRARSLFGQAWGAVRLTNVPGARLVRSLWPSRLVAARTKAYWLPLLGWLVRVNADELAGLLALPVGNSPLPGTPATVARQIPPPVEMGRSGVTLADSTYPGLTQPLVITPADQLLHIALLGPTGVGKSTLMASMCLQAAARGDGLAILDPKADLAADVLRRLPADRYDDVIVINPIDTDRPVGFNVLATDGSELARELAVDHVLHIFRQEWKDFWGPRSDSVLRSGLLLLTHATAPDGSAYTLCELPQMLSNSSFRHWLVSRTDVPPAVRDFLAWFVSLSAAERAQVIGPVLTKLTAFTQRTPIRLVLGQSEGLDLSAVLRDGKILVMSLSRGLVGTETAALLSSLLFGSLWQVALRRVRVPAAQRHPFWLFVDEAAEVVELPVDLADVMAEARGLGVGLILAAQHVSQMPTAVRQALLGTVRSQVVFQMEAADARLLARSFEPTLQEADLRALAAFEVAMRLAINGQTSRPMTGRTRPLPEPTTDGTALRQLSRERYGRPRAEVEQALRRRLKHPAASRDFGRRRRTGGRS